MRVKLGENLGLSQVALLRQAGHDVQRVTEQGLSGAADTAVWQRACAEGRLLITLDLGFADLRRFAPGGHPGVLLLRAPRNSRAAVTSALHRVLFA